MRVGIASYACPHCESTFDAPALAECAYGEFLLWSRSGQVAYLNALEDPTYQEVGALLDSSYKHGGLQPSARASVIQNIYGALACDPDAAGFSFDIDALPPCPACAGAGLASWTSKKPEQVAETTVPNVTHHRWNSLSDVGKQALVDARLESLVRERLQRDM